MHSSLLTTLLSLALILIPTGALPLDPTSADSCHQGVYCGSYAGEPALVRPLPLSSPLLAS
jgi:hypothetical protein